MSLWSQLTNLGTFEHSQNPWSFQQNPTYGGMSVWKLGSLGYNPNKNRWNNYSIFFYSPRIRGPVLGAPCSNLPGTRKHHQRLACGACTRRCWSEGRWRSHRTDGSSWGGTWRPQQGSENGSHIGGRWNHSISLCLRSKYFLRGYFTWRIDLISKDHPHGIHGNGIFEYKYHKNWSNGGRYASPIYYRHLDSFRPFGGSENNPKSLGQTKTITKRVGSMMLSLARYQLPKETLKKKTWKPLTIKAFQFLFQIFHSRFLLPQNYWRVFKFLFFRPKTMDYYP